MLGVGLGLHKQQMLKKPSFILDNINANMLYLSTAKLSSDDTLAVRVRRSSDNAEKDIGFIGKDLDIQDLLNFVGSGNGYIISTYSQGTVSSSQGLADSQPLIVENGIYLEGFQFNGAQWLDTGLTRFGNTGLFADENEEFTAIVVTEDTTTGTIIGKASVINTSRTFHIYVTRRDTYYDVTLINRGKSVVISEEENFENLPSLISVTWNKEILEVNAGGVFQQYASGTAAEETLQRIIIGARSNGDGYYLVGKVRAVILLDKALTTEERQKIENYLNNL